MNAPLETGELWARSSPNEEGLLKGWGLGGMPGGERSWEESSGTPTAVWTLAHPAASRLPGGGVVSRFPSPRAGGLGEPNHLTI